MKFSITLFKLSFALLCAAFAIGCTETDESIDNREHGYGYVQFKLNKKATRANDELDYLRDAYKVTLTMIKDNQAFNQTVLVEEADASIAEFGLRTEKLKLMVGDYRLTSYTIYNVADEKILVGEPGEATNIKISQSKLLVHVVDVKAVERGHIQFKLIKGLEAITPKLATRASAEMSREFTFDEITKVDIILRNQEHGRSLSINGLKCKFIRDDKGSSYLRIDSLVEVQAVDYQLERYSLWDASSRALSTVDCREDKVFFEVKSNETLKADVKVAISPTALYILDYIALKKIYDKMDGKNWSWLGDGFPTGAQWNFDKDIDLWYEQPGVMIHPNGRVAALNLGAQNPSGAIPEELGQMDALVELWAGTHNDIVPEQTSTQQDSYNYKHYDTWARRLKGERIADYRWELAKEEMLARVPSRMKSSEIFERNICKPEAAALWNERLKGKTIKGKIAPARPYADVEPGYKTNHITALPKSIGNLVNLELLFVANSDVTTIPDEIIKCISLTDLELYNNSLMVTFPMAVTRLPNLVSLNFAMNPQMPTEEIEKGFSALFSGPSYDKFQMLYANGNNIKVFPESAKNLKKIGLLDLANNKIHTMPAMTQDVSPVQFFLENNQLTSLPKNFCCFDDIEIFSIANNKLTSFPNIFTIETDFFIGSLDFSGNQISTIDGYNMETRELEPDRDGEVFKGLQAGTLNLSANHLKGGFPAAFTLSKADISQYNLSYNQLDSIGAKGLMKMKFTTAMDLSCNYIRVAPLLEDILIGQEMPFLTGIDLSFNEFEEFPSTLFNGYSITSFFFSSQKREMPSDDGEGGETYRCFTKWPDGIEQYAQLKVLKMDYNDLRNIRVFPELVNFLAIDGNPNVSMTIPAHICSRMQTGSFGFTYDLDQTGIKGCPALGIK